MKMKKAKYFVTVLTVLMMMLASSVLCMAECTDDYEFGEDEQLDFCVYNIWAESFVEAPAGEISSIQMVVDVTDYAGDPVSVKLYSRDNVSWLTWMSEPQTISGDGTYTFVVSIPAENVFLGENLCTIYVKDTRCCKADEDPEGEELDESGVACHMKLVSVDYNVAGAGDGGASSGDGDVASDSNVDEATEAATEAVTEAAPATTEEAKKDDDKGGSALPVVIIVIVVVVIAVVAGTVVSKKKKD